MDIIEQIENSRRFAKEPGVVLTGRLMEGRLPWKIPYIHIAGTNGKGSTAAFLASVLQECGYRVGLFTSPHLIDFTERIRVNGVQITREEACRLAEKVCGEAETLGMEAGMFDYCTVMAVDYFTEQNCDIAIIETGLGGRLDSTNALGVPELSVITPIGLDHVQILGGTIEEIASEKAGIIKQGAPAVIGKQVPEALAVLERVCREKSVKYRLAEEGGEHGNAGGEVDVRNAASGVNFENIGKDGSASCVDDLRLGLRGAYQRENAATALACVEALRERGWKLSPEAVLTGLANARWPGRLEQVWEEPVILLDGAHNLHGVKALKKSLEKLYPGGKYHFLMGVLADKDYREMFEEMLPLAERIDTVTPESARALQGEELSKLIRGRGVPSEFHPDMKEAFWQLKALPGEKRVCIFGSLYFIGEIEKMIKNA